MACCNFVTLLYTHFFKRLMLAAEWLSCILCCHVMQQAMYEAVVDYWESRGHESGPEEVAHLGVITALKKICNHPSLVILRQSEPLLGEVLSYTICRLVQNLTHKCSNISNGLSQGSNLNSSGSFLDICVMPVPG
jgi:SNF2 family DNA or RNA helicase